MAHQKAENCIRHEGRYRNVGVYVVVVMDGECPVEVQVSLAFDQFESLVHKASALLGFSKIADLVNVALKHGLPVFELIKFLRSPQSEMSGIIGDALIAAMDGNLVESEKLKKLDKLKSTIGQGESA